MRITNKMMSDHAMQRMSANLEQIHRLQTKIASGKKFQNSSDDPLAASISLSLRSELNSINDYKNSAQHARDWMTATELALYQLSDINTRAINLVTRGLNDTLSTEERASALAQEMDSLLNQAVHIGNTNHNGAYILAGFKTTTRPFLVPGDNTILYQGDNGVMYRNLGPAQSTVVNITGDQDIQTFFNRLVQARNALNSSDSAAMAVALDDLQSSLTAISSHLTVTGARIRHVKLAEEFFGKAEIEIKNLLSTKEDINLAEGISMLRNQEMTYQAVLEVSRRAVSSMTLFDYLR